MTSDAQSIGLTAHPESHDLSTRRLQKLYAEADEKLSLFEDLGSEADPELYTWTLHDLRILGSELQRRGVKPYSIPHLGQTFAAESKLDLLAWREYLTTITGQQNCWTVEGLLPAIGLAVLQGRGKQGKSTLVRHLCGAVASGQQFLRRATTAKPVVYVNYEMPDSYMKLLLNAAEIPSNAFILNWPEPVLQLRWSSRRSARIRG